MKRTSDRSQSRGWYEEYTCGCTSDTEDRKKDLPGYCPTHGTDRRYIHPHGEVCQAAVDKVAAALKVAKRVWRKVVHIEMRTGRSRNGRRPAEFYYLTLECGHHHKTYIRQGVEVMRCKPQLAPQRVVCTLCQFLQDASTLFGYARRR